MPKKFRMVLSKEWKKMSKGTSYVTKEITSLTYRFGYDISDLWVKKLKENAPSFSSFLRESIELVTGTARNTSLRNRWFIVINAPYAMAQEEGLNQPHFVHRDSVSMAGYKFGDWMDAKGFVGAGMYVGMPDSTRMGKENAFFSKTAREMFPEVDSRMLDLLTDIRRTIKTKL